MKENTFFNLERKGLKVFHSLLFLSHLIYSSLLPSSSSFTEIISYSSHIKRKLAIFPPERNRTIMFRVGEKYDIMQGNHSLYTSFYYFFLALFHRMIQ